MDTLPQSSSTVTLKVPCKQPLKDKTRAPTIHQYNTQPEVKSALMKIWKTSPVDTYPKEEMNQTTAWKVNAHSSALTYSLKLAFRVKLKANLKSQGICS